MTDDAKHESSGKATGGGSVSDERDATQRGVNNTRWDSERKRDSDRIDTQRTLENTRWDSERKRDGDRADAADALGHSRQDTLLAFESSLYGATHGAFVTVASASIDRSLQRATAVTTASSAVVTIYTGLLAAGYATGNAPKVQAVIPALFLGLSVIFAATYMAFLHQKSKDIDFLDSARGVAATKGRLLGFVEWVLGAVYDRAWALRVAIISLGFGLGLLPLAFVGASAGWTAFAGAAAGVLLVLWLLGEWLAPAAWPAVASARSRAASQSGQRAAAGALEALETLRTTMGPDDAPAEGPEVQAAARHARKAVDRARKAQGRAADAARRAAAAEDEAGYLAISALVSNARQLALLYPERMSPLRPDDPHAPQPVPEPNVVAPPAERYKHERAQQPDVETLFGPVLEVTTPASAVGAPFAEGAAVPPSPHPLVPAPVAQGSTPPQATGELVGAPFGQGADCPPPPDWLVPTPFGKGTEPPDYPEAPHKPFPIPPFASDGASRGA